LYDYKIINFFRLRFFIELSYFGKDYHGWQIQPNAISVQEVLQKSLSLLLNTKIEVVAAGRTDAGVHATQMFAHFDFMSEIKSSHLIHRLNSFLPKDISIINIRKVNDDAHARFDATERSYFYRISEGKNSFSYNYAYNFTKKLNLDLMNKACEILLDYTDFKCFSKIHTDVKTFNCDIRKAFWTRENDQLTFHITADRFLRNMVRAIVGTLINVGLEKISINDVHEIIKSKDRGEAGYSVPAHGLYLSSVKYPNNIYHNE
jgi:tRNA pseudouridine38-40 synthase